MNINPTLLEDGYKVDHRRQYVPETVMVHANRTARKSRVPGVTHTVTFGIQAYILETLIEIWNEKFFKADINQITDEFMEEMVDYTLNPDFAKAIGIDHWKALHKLGYLPLHIKALPEGTLCPIRVPDCTITSTHDDFYWITNIIETDMQSETWLPTTSATTAYQYRKIFDYWAKKTGGDPEFIPFQGHDFSYRGMAGRHAAMMSGGGHLTSFCGTDTIPAIKWLKKNYKADTKDGIIGCSVFATEHAVMCVSTGFYILKNGLTWEKYGEAEFEVFKRLITELYPTGFVSIVSDTWDLWKVLLDYVVRLKDVILARDGKVIIRPDSGDPETILCGVRLAENNPRTDDPTPADKGVVKLLWDTFGGTEVTGGDGKKYKLLDSHIGCIYGDSITTERAWNICEHLADNGFCSTNWVAGIGSFTYQYVTRDTFGFAQKATYAEVILDGKRHSIDVFKDPVTDDGTKKSARGLVGVFKNEQGELYLKDQLTLEEEATGLLQTVFLNGKVYNVQSLKEIRERIISQSI